MTHTTTGLTTPHRGNMTHTTTGLTTPHPERP